MFVTLSLSYLGLCALERLQTSADASERRRMCLALVGLFAVLAVARCDYGVKGLGCVSTLYLLRGWPVARFVVGSSCLGSLVFGSLAFLPIGMYNGERGFIRGRALQLLFYATYPAHMLVLWWVRMGLLA